MLRGNFGTRSYGGMQGYTGSGRVFKDWQDAADQLCDWREIKRISGATKDTVMGLIKEAHVNSIALIHIWEED